MTYYYRKNLFGDIVEIYDDENQLAASYTYDAWGNFTVGTNVDNIANVNPFRYRGYYYDWKTRYYYLQTRYYDAEVGRFLNADSIAYLDPETINGCNLYAYCLDNPVMYVDPSGHFLVSALIIGGIIGAAVGFGVAAYIDYSDDGSLFNGSVAWYDYVGSVVLLGAVGATLGALATTSITATIPTGLGVVQTTAGTTAVVVTSTATVTIAGAQVAAVAATAILGGTVLFAEHTKNKRRSTHDKHTRRRSGAPEKKDARMKYRKWKRPKGMLIAFLKRLIEFLLDYEEGYEE